MSKLEATDYYIAICPYWQKYFRKFAERKQFKKVFGNPARSAKQFQSFAG